MLSFRKRLLGVSFLACALVALGSCNLLVVGLIAFSGRISIPWSLIMDVAGRSAASTSRFAGFVSLTWSGVGLACIVLGMGLAAYRNWARIGVLLLVSAVGGLGLCALPLLALQAWTAVVALLALLSPLEWVIWYLLRPRVRFLFGAWRRESMRPPDVSPRGRIAVGAAALLTAFGLLYGVRFVTSEIQMHRSEAYHAGIESAQQSACVNYQLGLPIKAGWIMSGRASEDDSNGLARLRIPVRGPKGHGDLEVDAQKSSGEWTIRSLVLHHDSRQTQILNEGAESGCE